MATKARQQYFADEDSLQKIRREFSIADDIQQKIDGIEEGAQVNVIETVKVNGTPLIPDANKAVNVEVPEVIDNLYTIDSDNALSAKQGKLLYDYIQNIASRGRFLSNWNSATGLPMTNPSESPYPYKSGDYFVVSNIAGLGGTNYRPDGSSYIIGQASTVVETESVDVSDFYFYDGTNWLLLKNSSRSGAVDSSLSTTSTNPVENRVITNALNGKQDTLIAGTNIQIAADGKTISATDTTYTAGTGINIDANNVISNTQTSAEWGNITGTLSNQTDLQNALNNKANKTDVLEKTNTTSYTPSGDYNPATKKYVDDSVSAATAGAVSDTAYGTSWDGVTGIAPSKNAVYDKINSMDTTIAGKQDTLIPGSNISISGNTISATDTTYTAGTGIAIDSNNEISNTGVTSVNGSTGAVTVLESQTKVFPMPAVGDDISDLVSWLSAGKIAVLFAGYDTPGDRDGQYYQIYSFEEGLGFIYCEKTSPGNSNTVEYWIRYSTSTYIVQEKQQTVKLFAPMGGTAGQVLTQTSTGNPSWQTPSGGDVVVSSQTGNILQSGMKIWAGLETDYGNLGTYDSNTLYLTIE